MNAALSESPDWAFSEVPRRPGDGVLVLGEDADATARALVPAVARVVVGPDGLAAAPDSFDTVLCRSLLCRSVDPRRLLGEIGRVLTPRGWLGLIEPVVSEDPTIAEAENRDARRADPTLIRALSASALQDTLVRCGFEVAGARTWTSSAAATSGSAPVAHPGDLDTMTSLLVLNLDD